MIAAAVLGSGIAFLDGSVVTTALPKIRESFDATLAGQQWVVTGYLLTLGSLLVVGGSLGDLYGRRRIFILGLIGFSVASLGCGLAPSLELLIAARIIKGVAAAMLVPGSLAMLSAVFHPDDRATAIGSWSGLASVSTALGPFLGGWLIDSVSWRWVFLMNPVLAAAAVALALRYVPETKSYEGSNEVGVHIDVPGAIALSLGLAGVVYGLIEGPPASWPTVTQVAVILGVICLVIFVAIELRTSHPMVPLAMFRSTVFAGANAATFVIWGALSAVFFVLTLRLQNDLGYSAVEAGSATLPLTVLMFLFSAAAGKVAQRVGARLPMVIGPLVIGLGFALLARVEPGSRYVVDVLPGVLIFAVGLVVTVAPLTATVLGAVADEHAGVGSAINNAVARIAGLLAIAVLPALSGIGESKEGSLGQGFSRSMLICGACGVVGAVICALTIPKRIGTEGGPPAP